MNAAPDPAEIVAPSDPAIYARRRPLLGPGFWAMLALCIACVILGALVTRFGPTWFPIDGKPASGDIRATPSATPPGLRAPVGSPAPIEASPPVAVTPAAEIDRLESRIVSLEAGQKGVLDAAWPACATPYPASFRSAR
jgi:hypothetical protein